MDLLAKAGFTNIKITSKSFKFSIHNLEMPIKDFICRYPKIDIQLLKGFNDCTEDSYIYLLGRTQHKHLYISDYGKGYYSLCVGNSVKHIHKLFDNKQYLTIAITIKEILQNSSNSGYHLPEEVLLHFSSACSCCLSPKVAFMCDYTKNPLCNKCAIWCEYTFRRLSPYLVNKCSNCEKLSSKTKLKNGSVFCRDCY